MVQKLARLMVMFMFVVTGSLLTFLIIQFIPQSARAAGALNPTIRHTVLPVNCISVPVFTNTFTKLSNFGNFDVVHEDSVVEATFNGRISADSLASSNGAVFELRVDDQPSPVGRARATIRLNELPGSSGVQVSITGVFPDLAAGEHTVSLWVRAGGVAGSGTGARVDPGCWSSDHIVVREYAPFGLTFLPSITN
jgi:hypothetical protein